MTRQLKAGHDYTDRLLRLVPAEFISIYLAVSQTVASRLDLRQPVLLVTAAVFAILIPVYLYKVQGVTDRLQIAVTTVGFLVWTYSLGGAYQPGPWIATNLHVSELASVTLLVWTGVPPLFFGENGNRGDGAVVPR